MRRPPSLGRMCTTSRSFNNTLTKTAENGITAYQSSLWLSGIPLAVNELPL
jgi:hypothetical protein